MRYATILSIACVVGLPMNHLPASAAPSEVGEAKTETRPIATAASQPTVGDPSGQAQAGRVERTAFTTAVIDREPQDSITTLSNDQRRLYYFSELLDLEGEAVTHRWEFQGEVVAEVSFDVGGPRWRVHSSKELMPAWLGTWTVSVVDSSGRTLRSDSFTLTQAAPKPALQAAPSTTPAAADPAPPAEIAPPAQPPRASPARD